MVSRASAKRDKAAANSASKNNDNSSSNKQEVKKEEDQSSSSSSNKDNEDDSVRESYQELCRELNMDKATNEAAWKAYTAIKQNYTLEVSRAATLLNRLL